MKILRLVFFLVSLVAYSAAADGDFVEHFDTIYNSLTVEKRGNIVELRARARGSEALESAVDLSDPLQLVVHYTRSLYGALFIQPKPESLGESGAGAPGEQRGIGGAGRGCSGDPPLR